MEVGDFMTSAEVGNSSVDAAALDLEVELQAGVTAMREVLSLPEHAQLSFRPEELKTGILKRFIKNSGVDISAAVKSFEEWVSWRRENNADSIAFESIQPYVDNKEAVWHGESKAGMRCCFITGRYHDPLRTTGPTFKQFVLHTAEQGCVYADEAGRDMSVCVVYDRRGLAYSHVDPVAFQVTAPLIGDLQRYYGHCVGAIYIVHVNWLWYLGFMLIRPILDFLSPGKLVLLPEAKDILQYIDESQLPPGFLADDLSGSGSQSQQGSALVSDNIDEPTSPAV